jgi:hypothetical protein
MKKIYLLLIITTFSFLAKAQVWENVGSQGFTGNAIDYSSMAVDNSGIPIVAYINKTTRIGSVSRYDQVANAWTTVGATNVTGGAANQIKLAVDSLGDLYAAYVNNNVIGITVKKLVGSTWTTIGAVGFSGPIYDAFGDQYWDFDVNNTGSPYVIFFANNATTDPTVMTHNGTAWTTIGTVPTNGAVSGSANIEILNTGNPAIAFGDDGGTSIKVLRWSTTFNSWVNKSSAGDISTPNGSDIIRMKINTSNDVSNLAWREFDGVANFFGTVKRHSGGGGGASWISVGAPQVTNGSFFDLSLIMDNANRPMIAYPDGSGSANNKAFVKSFNGTSWQPLGDTLFTSNGISVPSLVTDNAGNPYLSFSDWGAGDFASVVKLSNNPLSFYDLRLLGSAIAGKNALTCTIDDKMQTGTITFEKSVDGIKFTSLFTSNITTEMYNARFVKASDIFLSNTDNYYRVKYTDAANTSVYSNSVKLSTVSNTSFNVYPNPVQNELFVQATNNGPLYLADATGKIIANISASNTGTTAVDVSNLPKGLYFIFEVDGAVSKFIKQ